MVDFNISINIIDIYQNKRQRRIKLDKNVKTQMQLLTVSLF